MSSCVRKEVQDKTLFRQLEGFVCGSVCCGDDSHGINCDCERERGIIVCCLACCPIGTKCSAGDPHDWPAHSLSSPAVFSLLGFRIIWGGGFCIFILFAKLVVITNSDLEFWSSFGSFCQLFLFLLFNFCKFCPFVTAIIQNFVSTNGGKEIVQLKEQKKKKQKGKSFKLEIIYYIYFHERT